MPASAKSKVIPYTRPFRLGAVGDDVWAVKRALRKAGYLQKPLNQIDKVMGPWAIKSLKKFQKANNIKEGVGRYSKPTHRALVAHHRFDAFGAHLMQKASKKMGPGDLRNKVVATAMFAHSHSPRHYTQDMYWRMEGVNKEIKPPDMWHYADCSGFATWCYWVAGAPDPNGLGYNGYGFTGTMADHGHTVSSPKPGDLVLYGAAPDFHHVAVYVGHNMVVSHGHEGGPFYVSMYYRSDISQFRSYLP